MKSSDLSACFPGWFQYVSRVSTATVNHTLLCVPLYLGCHQADSPIGRGDKYQLSSVSYGLIVIECLAAIYLLCQSVS